MRTAILVGGEFREFEISHKTWTFLDEIEYDLYFSTWTVTEEINPMMNIHIYEEVTKDRILRYFPNATINIVEMGNYSTNPVRVNYHWRKLFNMMTMSGIEYDNIILTRPDVTFNNGKGIVPVLNRLEDDIIYALSGISHTKAPGFIYVNDCLFLGKTTTMRNAILSFPPCDISYKDIHYHLAKHFVNNDYFVEDILRYFEGFYVTRSIHRGCENIDFETRHQMGVDWWNKKHRIGFEN